MTSTLYPPSPVNPPKNLTGLTPSYQFRAFLAILAILLFFALYFALVAALGYLVYWAIMYPMTYINKLTLLAKLGAIAGAVMLLAFTLKFIFKLKNHTPENRIKLDKKAHPQLVDFVYRICAETGAPRPKSIYLDPDVNAYVSYTNMWLSLFLPVGKDLTIGMGLVSCLNLSEFKAVVAHEFGHFAQRSMKIGSYIVSANTIIHDMIFTRDKWDETLERWRRSDFRLSAAAWVITPVIWIIRKVLGLFYAFLNIMHSSLSREMEFNADKVAVKAAGSEGIVAALWKLDDGSANWNDTLKHAYLASQKQMFTTNLYQHNQWAIERISDHQQKTLSELPEDTRGGKRYFSSSESSKVGMYASHPPNDHRENSAKNPFIACEVDSRSPWLLFSEPVKLQEQMTDLVYRQYFQKQPANHVAPQHFEAFIEGENQHRTLLAEYHNTFEKRFLQVPRYEEIENVVIDTTTPIVTQIEDLKSKLEGLMSPIWTIEALMQKAQQIAGGTTKESSFAFSGKTYGKNNLQEGFDALVSQREEHLTNDFKEWDKQLCALHLAMAKEAGKAPELWAIYDQYYGIVWIYKLLVSGKNFIFSRLRELQAKDQVQQFEIDNFKDEINQLIVKWNEEIQTLDKFSFVALPNIDNVEELKAAIIEGKEFKKVWGNIFQNGGFAQTAQALDRAINNCQRLDQKIIGVMLKFHHDLT